MLDPTELHWNPLGCNGCSTGKNTSLQEIPAELVALQATSIDHPGCSTVGNLYSFEDVSFKKGNETALFD
jgi:hypothetical protein